ncbi:MAG: S8 family serine peptidase, partial [Gammaproteobacteria bacterium]|nr:S8 family serine peptidase [Gammaproteobacteria bacterium]
SVTDTIEQQVESSVTDTIEQQVESSVTGTIEQQVESSVTDSIEQQVESTVTATIEQQVESSVTDTVEQHIESSVTESIAQQIEAGVSDGIAQQIESTVAGTIEQQLVSGVADGLEQQVEGAVTDGAAQQIESALKDLIGDRLAGANEELEAVLGEPGLLDPEDTSRLRGAVRQSIDDAVRAAGGLEDGTGGGADGASGEDGGESALADRFVEAAEAGGRAIERDVWIILVPPQHVERIDGWGFDIQERQTLSALNRELVRVSAPADRELAEAALELALDAPGTLVDFNHVYRQQAEEAGDGGPAIPAVEGRDAPARGAVGIVDTAVDARHEAFRSASIVQRDFVSYDVPRPTRHGTAVASILVGSSGGDAGGARQPRQPDTGRAGATLYAASVFFEDGAGNAISTTESLVEALAWLRGEGVPVVNMSLSGPPNRVLEAAIDTVAQQGTVVVAAVGNNGPAGEALYPAAYDAVVGVTAVDAANHVYPFANRGRQVMFAAPGVAVEVARSGGGYGTETGTSMAAPYAAAVIARSLRGGIRAADEALAALQATAVDLGDKDFDEIYGFGLIVADDLSASRASR